jgi:hypothetical protein
MWMEEGEAVVRRLCRGVPSGTHDKAARGSQAQRNRIIVWQRGKGEIEMAVVMVPPVSVRDSINSCTIKAVLSGWA